MGAPTKTLKAKRAYYPADDEVKNFVRKCKAPKPSKGRKCIVPGSVVIMLSGRFRGRRVVVLKRMDSGLLLVTGPYKLNGVPLKRVNAAYVLPTSSKLNVSGINVADINNNFFGKTKAAKNAKSGENQFFGDNAELSAEEKARVEKKRAMQKTVDGKLMELVKKQDQHFAGYLRTRFTLRNNMRFHEMSF